MNLKVEAIFTRPFLLTQPTFELFGSMSGSIIEDEGHRLHLSAKSFWNDFLRKKVLEISKAFALPTSPVDQTIGNREPCEQMVCPTSVIACFVQDGLVGTGWTRRLLPFSGLKGSLLIQTEQPRPSLQKSLCLSIGLQGGAGSLEKGLGIMDMLPGMIAPRANMVSFEPTPAPPCWLRWKGACDPGPRSEPPQLCSNARAVRGAGRASYKRWRSLGHAPEGEKCLGALLRGASANECVVTQRPRHLRTVRSVVPQAEAIC